MSWAEKLSIRIARKIVPAGDSYTVGQVSHGIEIFLWQVLGAVSLIAISTLFDCVVEAITVSGIYMLLRNFTGGVHFKGALACFITGNVLMLAAALLAKQLPADHGWFSFWFVLSSTVLSFWINLRYAPAPHTYVQIDEHIRRRNRKTILLILIAGCVISQILVYFDYKQLGHAYSIAVLLQSLLLHPLAYRAMEQYEKSFSRKG
jgi:accessory gene regulator protein AgrB